MTITEKELIIPALKALRNAQNGTLTTTQLIQILRNELKPTGDDLTILKNRSDDKFSQKVRNLKSHNSFTGCGLATYTPPKPGESSGTFTITKQGEIYIKNI